MTDPVPAAKTSAARSKTAWTAFLLLMPLSIFLLLTFFYPLAYTLWQSLGGQAQHINLSQYTAVFQSATERGVFGLTFILAIGSTVLSVVLSVPLALVLRRKFWGSKMIQFLILVPALIPGLVGALGLLFFYDQAGWLNVLLVKVLHVLPSPLAIDYTIPGLILFYVWMFFPFGGLVIMSGLGAIDPGLEEAARVMGATPWRTFWRVIMPLLRSSLFSGSILVFLQAFGAFSIPIIAGGNYQPIAVRIYTVATVFLQWPKASAMAILMGLIQVLILILYGRMQAGQGRGRTA